MILADTHTTFMQKLLGSGLLVQYGLYLGVDAMWLLVILVLAAGAFGLLPGAGWIDRLLGRFDGTPRRVILGAFLIRLVPTLIPKGAGYDIQCWQLVGKAILDHQSIYGSGLATAHYPYFPLMLYICAAAMALALQSLIPFVILVKLPFILFDSLLAGFIAYQLPAKKEHERFSAGLLYAVNPITILVCAYHGQFDSTILLMVAISFWLLSRSPQLRSVIWSALSMGIAVLLKPWGAIFVLYAALRLHRPTVMALYGAVIGTLMALVVAVYVLLFPDTVTSLTTVISGFHGAAGGWGPALVLTDTANVIGALTGPSHVVNSYGFIILALSLVSASWLCHRAGWEWAHACMTLVLVFMVFSNAFSLQYASWIVPFALLTGRRRELLIYTAAGLLWLAPAYFLWHIFPVLLLPFSQKGAEFGLNVITTFNLLLWLVAVWWLFREVRGTPARESNHAVSMEAQSVSV